MCVHVRELKKELKKELKRELKKELKREGLKRGFKGHSLRESEPCPGGACSLKTCNVAVLKRIIGKVE